MPECKSTFRSIGENGITDSYVSLQHVSKALLEEKTMHNMRNKTQLICLLIYNHHAPILSLLSHVFTGLIDSALI